MPIVYKRASDGGISVCIPAISLDDPEGFSSADAYVRALAKDIPKDATQITQINPGDIDLTDPFRNSWTSMNTDKSFQYDGTIAKDIVDNKLKLEMKSYIDELNLLSNMGRDTSAVKASISECQNRVSQLDKMTFGKSHSADHLTTLKSLIK